MREWKPGDVAMVECSDGEWRRAGLHRGTIGNPEAWVFEDGAMRRTDESRARPLVVIDPEDREQVEALIRAIEAVTDRVATTDKPRENMQAALRALIADPKPEEPQGLGAVVEVESTIPGLKGVKRRLVRGDASCSPWMGDGQKREWSEIAGPIKILSEGVS